MTDVESLFVCCVMCCTEAKGDSCSAASIVPCLRGCRICFTSSLGHIGLLRNTAVLFFNKCAIDTVLMEL